MSRGCYGCSGRVLSTCGNPCFSLGPFRATSSLCPPQTATTGSIIAYASGLEPVVLLSALGVAEAASAIGFGSAVPVVPIGDTITLPILGALFTEAFNVPRDGTVTSISATFSLGAELDIAVGGSARISARLYRAPAGSNVFTATNAFVNLSPTLTGLINAFEVLEGTANVNLPVRAGERLLLVFRVETTGFTLIEAIEGAASAGINIV